MKKRKIILNKVLRVLKVILIYFFVASERIFLIPFSSVRPCTIIGVLSNEFEAKRLFHRNCIGWSLTLAYLFPFWIAIALVVFGVVILIKKIKDGRTN